MHLNYYCSSLNFQYNRLQSILYLYVGVCVCVFRNEKLEEDNGKLQKDIELLNNEVNCLKDECREHRYEKMSLKEQIDAINMVRGILQHHSITHI